MHLFLIKQVHSLNYIIYHPPRCQVTQGFKCKLREDNATFIRDSRESGLVIKDD